MRRLSVLAPLVLALLLPACETNDGSPKDSVGAKSGAATSDGLERPVNRSASKPLATPPSVLLAGWLGSAGGASLDKADRAEASRAESRACAAPIGQVSTWKNPQSGHSGTIVPVRDDYASNGAYCRTFQQTLNLGGPPQQGTNKACQQPDGSWKIVP